MDIVEGTPAALNILFKVGEQPVAPDVGTVTYTVQDQAGTQLAGLVDQPVTTTTTTFQTTILVAPSAQTIGAGRRFERRTIIVKFQVGGADAMVRAFYRVVPDFPHTVTPQQVRAFIGIEDYELPDGDIDLTEAYLAVEKDVGQADLATALTSGTSSEIDANTLVCMKAVLNVLPSAKQRMAQSEKNGVKEFSRVDLKELDKLADEALRRYTEALGNVAVTTTTTITFFAASSGTDAITG